LTERNATEPVPKVSGPHPAITEPSEDALLA
jgi:hypothetical protein